MCIQQYNLHYRTSLLFFFSIDYLNHNYSWWQHLLCISGVKILQLNSCFQIEKKNVAICTLSIYICYRFERKTGVCFCYALKHGYTVDGHYFFSISDAQGLYICKQLHLFLQLADSNSKEIKSKTKEWNDRIKQDKVSKTDSVYCIIFVFTGSHEDYF
jgi:hypothetical protein